MKINIAIVLLLIGTLLMAECVQSKKTSGFLVTLRKVWEPFVGSAKSNMYGAATSILKPMLELSKEFMDQTGSKMVDKFVAGIPNTTTAYENNDMMALQRRLNESQTLLQLIPQHITHSHFRKYIVERTNAHKSVVTCINQGKCGHQFFIYYLFDCANLMKTILSSN